MVEDRSRRGALVGAVAGGAIGLMQMRAQGYDFSVPDDVYMAIGFLLGFVLGGSLIGHFSSRKGRGGNEFDPGEELEN